MSGRAGLPGERGASVALACRPKPRSGRADQSLPQTRVSSRWYRVPAFVRRLVRVCGGPLSAAALVPLYSCRMKYLRRNFLTK